MTSAGGRSRSASRTRAWYRRSAVSPASAARVAAERGRGVVLGGEEHLGGLLGDLAADGVHATVEQATSCRSPPGARSARDAIVDQSVSSQAKPCVVRSAGASGRIEARPHVAVAGRSDRVDGHEQRVAVAVDGDVDEPQDVARRLALAPESIARPRVEVDLAGLDVAARASASMWPTISTRPSAASWTTAGTRPSGRSPDLRALPAQRSCRGRGATRSHGPDGTNRQPAAAIAALTAAIEWIRRWKIEAARTASAPPSTTAATKSSGPAAPPEAMTGTDTRSVMARSSVGVEAGARPVAVDRGHEQLAGAEVDRPLRPGDGVEAGRLAATLDDDLPGGVAPSAGRRRASMATTTAWRPNRPRSGRSSAGSATAAVLSETLSAPARSTSRISSTRAHAATDRQRDERAARGPLDDVEERAAPFRRRGDVEEHELVGAFAGVALGELRRIALVDEVDEADALDDATVGDVEAGDDAAAQHQAAAPARASAVADRRARPTKLASSRRPSVAAPLRVELDAEQVAARDGGHEGPPVLGRGEDDGRRPVRRHARVRVDEVEVGTVVDPIEERMPRVAGRPGSSRCAAGSGHPASRDVRPGRTPRVAAPSSSLPSNRSWSPRQMPRNGRSAAIQSRIGSTRPAAPGAPSPGPPRPTPGHDERIGVRRPASPSRAIGDRPPRRVVSACSMLTRLPAP